MKENVSQKGTNRRSFIKKTGAATLYGATALNMGFASPILSGSKDKLKVGLVGCGGRGTGAAVQALNADPDTVLYAMADAFEDRLTSSLEIMKKHMAQERRWIKRDNSLVSTRIKNLSTRV